MQYMLWEMIEENEKLSLEINFKSTFYIVYPKNLRNVVLEKGEVVFKGCDEFEYMGAGPA